MASLIISIAFSTSFIVVFFPRLNRIAASESSLLKPIALSTCEGSVIPEEHAEPEETSTLVA